MSFANYASQFLSKAQADPSSSRTSAQPLFFSFTTDENEGSEDLDDAADPHFQKYDSTELVQEAEDAAEFATSQYPDMEDEEGEGVGWLAHQRSPSPAYTLSPVPPPRNLTPKGQTTRSSNPGPIPEPQSLSLGLSQSLLPRTGAEAHAFHLPAPHSRSRSGRRRPQPNPRAAAGFLFTYTLLCVLSLLSLVLPHATERSPPAILHTIPLVTFLVMLSAVLSYIHLTLLRAFIRPVLLVSALAPPLALFLSSILAFAGSFSAGAGWGLRLFSLIPLALAVLSVRRLPQELRRAARSPALLSLSTRILFFRAPLLLLLSPLILLAGLICSLPLFTLLARLPLSHSWYMQLGSALVAFFTLHVYFVARAEQRSFVSAGVGAWYFGHSIAAPPPGSGAFAESLNTGYPDLDAQLRILHAALHRPLGPLVLSALFSLILSVLSSLQVVLVYLPLALPYRFIALFADMALDKIQSLGERIGGGRYTGVYCGLTGSGFWEGVRGVKEVRQSASERALPVLPLPRAYTLALPFALVSYLRAAGDRDGEEGISYAEQQRAAIAVALLAGAVCAAVSIFCAGVVRDCSDTLYMCHLIDRAAGKGPDSEGERKEVWAAFDPSPVNLGQPQDLETGFGGLNFGGFNFGGFGFGGGTTDVAGERERGGRGEEPVYARMRRTSEEANRKVPPPLPLPVPRPGPSTSSRGFRAPSGDFAASALRDLSPPPSRQSREEGQMRSSVLPPPPVRAPHVEDLDSDVDSLDSRSGGGESSGAFPGSGFF
ncbi:hypothetical protein FB45DRAFT_892582 [Roridomyces roridus]|uniref:Protein PNS1 n=1 Tax=Roridomyces roridus TaxID=1738132 RepID=A0AAD7CEZ3_9AGAR|nr:hypothetical protein FB45DRAFT_892582 [Roridomyces roridus]